MLNMNCHRTPDAKKKVGYIKLGTCFFSVFFLKSFWSNYSDLTPNGGLVREISYFNQNLGEGEILFHLANFHRFGFGKESTVRCWFSPYENQHASPFESHEKNSASWGFRPLCSVGLNCISYMSNQKHPGWLGYIGDYTTQLYRDYNKPL